jgi:hypothetical protein
VAAMRSDSDSSTRLRHGRPGRDHGGVGQSLCRLVIPNNNPSSFRGDAIRPRPRLSQKMRPARAGGPAASTAVTNDERPRTNPVGRGKPDTCSRNRNRGHFNVDRRMRERDGLTLLVTGIVVAIAMASGNVRHATLPPLYTDHSPRKS